MKVLFFAVLCGVLMSTTGTASTHQGVCPSEYEFGHFCNDPCNSDEDCGNNKFCCKVGCGKTCMERFQSKESPRCPGQILDIRCTVYLHQCNNDDECRRRGSNQLCCSVTGCGRSCTEEYPYLS